MYEGTDNQQRVPPGARGPILERKPPTGSPVGPLRGTINGAKSSPLSLSLSRYLGPSFLAGRLGHHPLLPPSPSLSCTTFISSSPAVPRPRCPHRVTSVRYVGQQRQRQKLSHFPKPEPTPMHAPPPLSTLLPTPFFPFPFAFYRYVPRAVVPWKALAPKDFHPLSLSGPACPSPPSNHTPPSNPVHWEC